ncbi:ferredoxin:thioredoxin reductase [Candidatus Woesearchaeota archaeon]|nr:ferredoxin:thioredoxin reductase [Candidatus Woesearchaeota archaeon]
MGEKEIKKLINIWEEFVDRQKNDKKVEKSRKFRLNPSKEKVEKLAEGVLFNEKKHGLKYCPCRLTTGDQEEDFKLICPCNFWDQKTWKQKGECWCSLFVKE